MPTTPSSCTRRFRHKESPRAVTASVLERVPPARDGEPAAPSTVVVECDGRLYDRSVVYTEHRYELDVPGTSGALLRMLFEERWKEHACDRVDDGGRHAAARVVLADLAAGLHGATTSPAIEQRRAWRIIDWLVRTEAPLLLEAAGFPRHAERFAALPAIGGSHLPPGAAGVFLAAYRETDAASTAALKGVAPYRRQAVNDRPIATSSLEYVAKQTVPGIKEAVRDFPRPPPLSKGLTAAGYASICIAHDPRIPPRTVRQLVDSIRNAEHQLVRELVAMGVPARRAKAA
jgi:hypothetical protein